MQTVVTAEEMRWCDETSIRTYGISGLLLMENAGKATAQLCEQQFGPLAGQQVTIFCGKGNNGGDGFVIARHLRNFNARIVVILMNSPKSLKGDAKTNFEILKKLQKASADSLRIQQFKKSILPTLAESKIIIDAMFGTGFSGAVRQPYADVIQWMNRQKSHIVSVDIPSGVNGTTGVVENLAVKATLTPTFGLVKTGLLCNQGRDQVGKMAVIDIGIPQVVSGSAKFKTHLIEAGDVRVMLPRRPSTAHKYNVGKVFVLAGSKGYTGAAALCATSVLKAGAGAVVLGTPESIYSILAKKLTEPIVIPLPSTSEGTIAKSGYDPILERANWSDVFVVGPGLSQSPETQELICELVAHYFANIIIDADGLNAIAKMNLKKNKGIKGSFILTPHVGEFSRLTGKPSKEIETSRIESARIFSSSIKGTIVLKGAPTATASADGHVYLNSTGNPGMATIGSGDVLTGLIAALWAQGMEQEAAAYSGVFLHGLAGDLACAAYGERSLVAHDLIDYLPHAFRDIESGGSR
ncbi:MAG: NAD(P)H-hydrate dehydratase [Ignavibacteriales bacterium]|nr:NAD(P)H-hydrate dehydratase [Ignavibacteriales bacterium]